MEATGLLRINLQIAITWIVVGGSCSRSGHDRCGGAIAVTKTRRFFGRVKVDGSFRHNLVVGRFVGLRTAAWAICKSHHELFEHD